MGFVHHYLVDLFEMVLFAVHTEAWSSYYLHSVLDYLIKLVGNSAAVVAEGDSTLDIAYLYDMRGCMDRKEEDNLEVSD